MNDTAAPPARVRLTRVAGIAWLILVSAFALIDHVEVAHLHAGTRAADSDHAAVVALQGRLDSLERTAESFIHRSPAVTPAMLEGMRSTLSERLAPLEQVSKAVASKDDLAPLADRLSLLEARLHRLKQVQPATPVDPNAATAANAPEPPFAVLGVELRGGERFLSVAPGSVDTLAQVRLVRVGATVPDVPGDWRLEALDGATAVFESAGHRVRITLH